MNTSTPPLAHENVMFMYWTIVNFTEDYLSRKAVFHEGTVALFFEIIFLKNIERIFLKINISNLNSYIYFIIEIHSATTSNFFLKWCMSSSVVSSSKFIFISINQKISVQSFQHPKILSSILTWERNKQSSTGLSIKSFI